MGMDESYDNIMYLNLALIVHDFMRDFDPDFNVYDELCPGLNNPNHSKMLTIDKYNTSLSYDINSCLTVLN